MLNRFHPTNLLDNLANYILTSRVWPYSHPVSWSGLVVWAINRENRHYK